MSDTAYVPTLPNCDLCRVLDGLTVAAEYDGRTADGRWANMCGQHFQAYGVGLGTGRGQRLIVGERPKPSRSDLMDAIERGDYDAAEDIIGDGDIAEWL